MKPPKRSLRLRTRLILTFGVGALLITSGISVLTYFLVRGSLTENRDQSALSVASVNARQAERRIFEGATDKAVRDFLSNLRGVRSESTAVLRLETDWISADPVVFPAPDGPTTETKSPLEMFKEILFNIFWFPKDLEIFFKTIIFS